MQVRHSTLWICSPHLALCAMTQIPWDGDLRSSSFAHWLGRGPVRHDRDWSHARCGNAVHKSEIPAAAIHDHYLGGGQHFWGLCCPEHQSYCRPSGLLPCHSDANASIGLHHQNRGLSAGDDLEWQVLGDRRRRIPGVITYTEYSDELATGIRNGFATANGDLGTGPLGAIRSTVARPAIWEILWRSLSVIP